MATMSLEAVIGRIGTGRFHYKLAVISGWSNASDAIEMLGISFIITTLAECDLDLTESRKGMVTAGLFIGMMLGGWIWGSLADKLGRKYTLVLALMFNCIFGFSSSLATSYHAFLFLRMMSGIGVGGSIPIVFTFTTEFLPTKKRGLYLSIVAAFWMVGTILVAGLAWGIIGSTECSHSKMPDDIVERCQEWEESGCGFYHTSLGIVVLWGTYIPDDRRNDLSRKLPAWRLFVAVCSVPSLVAAISVLFLPESPKWLASVGRISDAEKVLLRMARGNATTPGGYAAIQPSDLKISEVIDTESDTAALTISEDRVIQKQHPLLRIILSIRSILSATVDLFRGTTMRSTVLLAGIWFFLSMGFYGLTLWLPNYYQHGAINDKTSIYEVSFYVALANIPGNLFAFWGVEHIGRRKTLLISMLASAASVFSILQIHTTTGTTIFSCFFSGVSVAGWNSLNILSAELFTTHQRGAAFGLLAAIGRIGAIAGNMSFGAMSARDPTLPLILTGGALSAGALLALLLPETRNVSIE